MPAVTTSPSEKVQHPNATTGKAGAACNEEHAPHGALVHWNGMRPLMLVDNPWYAPALNMTLAGVLLWRNKGNSWGLVIAIAGVHHFVDAYTEELARRATETAQRGAAVAAEPASAGDFTNAGGAIFERGEASDGGDAQAGADRVHMCARPIANACRGVPTLAAEVLIAEASSESSGSVAVVKPPAVPGRQTRNLLDDEDGNDPSAAKDMGDVSGASTDDRGSGLLDGARRGRRAAGVRREPRRLGARSVLGAVRGGDRREAGDPAGGPRGGERVARRDEHGQRSWCSRPWLELDSTASLWIQIQDVDQVPGRDRIERGEGHLAAEELQERTRIGIVRGCGSSWQWVADQRGSLRIIVRATPRKCSICRR